MTPAEFHESLSIESKEFVVCFEPTDPPPNLEYQVVNITALSAVHAAIKYMKDFYHHHVTPYDIVYYDSDYSFGIKEVGQPDTDQQWINVNMPLLFKATENNDMIYDDERGWIDADDVEDDTDEEQV